jgi:probable HAF family extracellular repeat protein
LYWDLRLLRSRGGEYIITDLGTLGGTKARAYDINSSGQIAGCAYIAGNSDRHAFLYSNGVMLDLGVVGGMTGSGATDINASGQMAGNLSAGAVYHAMFYSGGVMYDLGTLGGTVCYGFGLNDNGQVVGQSTTGSAATHAFLYSGGTMVDLNTLLPAGSGWTLTAATDINNSGQIVGTGINSLGEERAFLMTPVPEPMMLGMLAMGGLALLRRRKE